jgi:hypothetical protein
MQIINRRVHGYLDYAVSVFLLFAPRVFGVAGAAEVTVFRTIAVVNLAYSIFTDYELGAFKVLPFGVHRTLDVLSGLVLALSPWLFGFADQTCWPYLGLGILELIVVSLTRNTKRPGDLPPGAPAAS